MPGAGRPGDPLWFAIGFVLGAIPGIYFHQLVAALGVGFALGVALALIRGDAKRGYTRPTDPLWFAIGLAIGLLGGLWLHYLGLSWPLGMGLGLALGLFFGAFLGTARADHLRNRG